MCQGTRVLFTGDRKGPRLNSPGREGKVHGVRAILHFVVSSVLCSSLLFAVVRAQAAAPKIEKTKCCAKMNAKAGTDDCARHAPKSDQEKQCCAACVIGPAVLPASAIRFGYPPTGDQLFARFVVRELVRSDRPQVPPPRFSVA